VTYGALVDNKTEIRDFLATRRARITPQQAGLPDFRGLTDLIGELSTRSDEFRIRWAARDVHQHRSGVKRVQHPVVGYMELSYEAMELVTDEGLTLLVYNAEPGSPAAESLDLLSSWAATEARAVEPGPVHVDLRQL
jgi:hypothetical protein